MFVLSYTYLVGEAEREPFLGAHHQFLDRHYDAGTFVTWGRGSDGRGVILAKGDDRAGIDAILAEDPFVRQGLVDVEVLQVEVSRSAVDAFRPR